MEKREDGEGIGGPLGRPAPGGPWVPLCQPSGRVFPSWRFRSVVGRVPYEVCCSALGFGVPPRGLWGGWVAVPLRFASAAVALLLLPLRPWVALTFTPVGFRLGGGWLLPRCRWGVGAYLRGQGCTVLSVRPASLCGRYLGVLLVCPGWLATELLTLPKPPAAGSLGVAALLPWY
jgi:hypothetical protein